MSYVLNEKQSHIVINRYEQTYEATNLSTCSNKGTVLVQIEPAPGALTDTKFTMKSSCYIEASDGTQLTDGFTVSTALLWTMFSGVREHEVVYVKRSYDIRCGFEWERIILKRLI